MTIEAAAGKNPVTHVGKLYNLLASRIAETIVANIEGITDAQCVLVSQIGRPVTDPQVAELRIACAGERPSDRIDQRVTDIMHAALKQMDDLRRDLIAGRVRLY